MEPFGRLEPVGGWAGARRTDGSRQWPIRNFQKGENPEWLHSNFTATVICCEVWRTSKFSKCSAVTSHWLHCRSSTTSFRCFRSSTPVFTIYNPLTLTQDGFYPSNSKPSLLIFGLPLGWTIEVFMGFQIHRGEEGTSQEPERNRKHLLCTGPDIGYYGVSILDSYFMGITNQILRGMVWITPRKHRCLFFSTLLLWKTAGRQNRVPPPAALKLTQHNKNFVRERLRNGFIK